MVAFKKFTNWGKQYDPRVSITTGGLMSFNQGAMNAFRMHEWDYVFLYYDEETRRIGIQNAGSEDQEGARRLRKRKTGSDISARTFYSYYGIPRDTTTRYIPKYDENERMVIFDLDSPLEARPRKTQGGGQATATI